VLCTETEEGQIGVEEKTSGKTGWLGEPGMAMESGLGRLL